MGGAGKGADVRINTPCLRKMFRWWIEYQMMAEDLLATSNLGYPPETSESRFGRELGARGSGGIGDRSKVPCEALDGLRMDREGKRIDKGMRIMPPEYRRALEADYRGLVEKDEYNRHRERLKRAVVWWQGYSAHR